MCPALQVLLGPVRSSGGAHCPEKGGRAARGESRGRHLTYIQRKLRCKQKSDGEIVFNSAKPVLARCEE